MPFKAFSASAWEISKEPMEMQYEKILSIASVRWNSRRRCWVDIRVEKWDAWKMGFPKLQGYIPGITTNIWNPSCYNIWYIPGRSLNIIMIMKNIRALPHSARCAPDGDQQSVEHRGTVRSSKNPLAFHRKKYMAPCTWQCTCRKNH